VEVDQKEFAHTCTYHIVVCFSQNVHILTVLMFFYTNISLLCETILRVYAQNFVIIKKLSESLVFVVGMSAWNEYNSGILGNACKILMNLEFCGEDHNCEKLRINTVSKMQGPSPKF